MRLLSHGEIIGRPLVVVDGRSGITRIFEALTVPAYRRFWWTGLVSNIGTAMQAVTLDWFVLELTHSGSAVGWAAGLQFAPVLLFGLWGGVASDRYDRRHLLLIAQALYTVQAIVLAVSVAAGFSPLWLVYLLCFWLGCVFTVENPARLSFVTELVGTPLIANAASLNILSITVARLIGPAVAGLLIEIIGSGWIFILNAVSCLVVMAGLAGIRTVTPARPGPGSRATTIGGLRHVARSPGLTTVLAIFGVVAMFGVNFPTVLTLFAGEEFDVGASGLGFMSAALSGGFVLGTLVAARWVRPSVRLVAWGAVGFGICELIAARAPGYPSFLALLVPVGFAYIVLNTGVSAYVQTEVTEAVRGRVMALYTVVSMGGTPIGAPIIGWIGEHAGVRWGMVAGAVISIAAPALVGVRFRKRGVTRLAPA